MHYGAVCGFLLTRVMGPQNDGHSRNQTWQWKTTHLYIYIDDVPIAMFD
jgi:hypothetical protein